MLMAEREWSQVMEPSLPAETTPARAAFREAVATVAMKAKAALPECHGRIDAAIKIVLAGDVAMHPDGTATVGSGSDPQMSHLVNGSCTCSDYARAPEGRCKHRLGRWIYKKATALAQEEMARMDTPTASWVEIARSNPPLTATPLPEAPASVNVRLMMGGREVQVTLRDHDETRLLERLHALLQRFPLETAAATPTAPRVGWCSTHGVQMTHREGRYFHKVGVDEATGKTQWCRARSEVA